MRCAEPAPPDPRQRLGRDGEEAAGRILREAGLTILETRYRTRMGELDIVAECGELLVFVEVKTRRLEGFGRPSESVTPVKRRRMARVALAWLQRHGALERPCRFDVVELLGEAGGPFRARHIEDAFRLWPTG